MPGPTDPEDLSVEAILIALESLGDQDREVLLLFAGRDCPPFKRAPSSGAVKSPREVASFEREHGWREVLGLDSTQRRSTNGHVDDVLKIKGVIEVRSLADD